MDTRDGLSEDMQEAQQVYSVLASGGMGSPAAIALAGAVTLIVAGVAKAKHDYNKHQSQKHLEKIKKVLELHNTYLVDIKETGFDECPSLPAPFVLDKKQNPTQATALKLNEALRQDLRKDKSVNNDAFLNQYSRHIKNAITAIIGFYDIRLSKDERSWFTRGSEDDVTSSVLTYLLVILSEHCTKFEGYQADIAYLDGIIGFMNAYASIPRDTHLEAKDPKKRQRFERLKFACKELRKAKQLLVDHSNSRTLKSFTDELMSACSKDFIPDLINLFAKGIVPENDWQYIDSAAPELLAAGLVRPEYKNSHTLFRQKAIPIPDSIFKTWLRALVADYLDADRPDRATIELAEEHLSQIKELFLSCQNFLTLKTPERREDGSFATDKFVPVGHDKTCQLKLLSQMPACFEAGVFLLIKDGQAWALYEVNKDKQPAELKIEEVKGLQAALAVLPSNKAPENAAKKHKKAIKLALTAYRNHEQLKNRANIFLELASLLGLVTDLNKFCEKLSDCIRDLGEIYVSNPHHCNFIFDSLNALAIEIYNRIGSLEKAIENVENELDGANDMLIKEQLDLATQLKNKLHLIQVKVTTTVSGIMDKHNVHNNRWGNPLTTGKIDIEQYDKSKKKKAIQEMLLLATRLVLKYKINNDKYELSLGEQPVNIEQKALQGPGLEEKLLEEKEPVNLAKSQLEITVLPAIDLAEETIGAEQEDKHSEKEIRISPKAQAGGGLETEDVLMLLRKRIDFIKANENPGKEAVAAYEQIYVALSEFDLVSRGLRREQEPHRQAKANTTRRLSQLLCRKTLDFLNYDRNKRKEQAKPFRDELQDEVSASRNRILDEHKSAMGKVLRAAKELGLCLVFGYGFYNAYKRGGFFRTSSRAAAYQVGESCETLAKNLSLSSG